jgi:phosphoribosylamine-glycine ligase
LVYHTQVLEFLTQTMSQCSGILEIIPTRSQAMELALLQPPFRTFLKNRDPNVEASDDKKIIQRAILVYCLPRTVTEYIQFAHDEASMVRSTILSNATTSSSTKTTDTVIVSFSLIDQQFRGTGGATTTSLVEQQIWEAATNPSSIVPRDELAAATLIELEHLDRALTQELLLRPRSTDYPNGKPGAVVLVVGSGGREHALAVALAHSPLVSSVVCCPGNGGTGSEQHDANPKIRNHGADQKNDTVLALVHELKADMVVVGPEQPLVDGLVDLLQVQCPDVLCFGPTQAAAELEASKAFTKDFLHQHQIPTAKYRTFTNVDEAVAYVESLENIESGSDRQVVKASGLAAGKGVLLPTTKEETIAAVREIMSDKTFGTAGDTCVIESFLTGPEASCFALCDGTTAVLMPAAQDHKRALDNDEGLNTGGMGAYAPAPCVTPDLQKEIEAMCQTTVTQMAARGTPYVGLLYAGIMYVDRGRKRKEKRVYRQWIFFTGSKPFIYSFMKPTRILTHKTRLTLSSPFLLHILTFSLTPDGPKMLEYNCRFGDPETQVVLPLLETDLYEVLKACCTGTLADVDVRFKENVTAATVVCAAKGYPLDYPKGMAIQGLDDARTMEQVKVYQAGTSVDPNGVTRCTGGRVLAVTGLGPNLKSALQRAYKCVDKLDFIDDSGTSLMHHRTDIAKKAIEKKLRIGVLGSTRGTALLPVMEACATGGIHAEIVAVVSNRSQAPILEKGKSLGTTIVSKFISSQGLTRAQYDAECTAALLGAGVEYVLLVGYMRILSKSFCEFWAGRCINVHPSLLPLHAGGMDLEVRFVLRRIARSRTTL